VSDDAATVDLSKFKVGDQVSLLPKTRKAVGSFGLPQPLTGEVTEVSLLSITVHEGEDPDDEFFSCPVNLIEKLEKL
jgi:hypothetical protein